MLFNSIDFAIFFPTIFILYWFVTNRSLRAQNLLIVLGSYLFYGWWDWRFLSLILLSSLLDFFVGIALCNVSNQQRRRLLLYTSLFFNLGILGFFKYFNFFIDNFSNAFTLFGLQIPSTSLNIVLPVGISFYTFQTLSYTIDIYKRKLQPTHDFVIFSAYVSFFPQLVAGPIERATNLLPQFEKKRTFDYSKATDGVKQMLWGFFKKLVIADNCAEIADYIFAHSGELSGSAHLIGALCFTFQIYGDFSGYSDIAIGTARLLGFDLMKNFDFPYFSRDIAEFWRRWHISLSTWFRDYLYIPLGGSRGNTGQKVKNTFIIFLVSGFWHGANWTFIFWGALNAIYFIPLLLQQKNRQNVGSIIGYDKNKHTFYISIKEYGQMIVTFTLTVIAWVFFRADTVSEAFRFLNGMFTTSLFSLPSKGLGVGLQLSTVFSLIIFFLVIEWKSRFKVHPLQNLSFNRVIRWIIYTIILFLIGMFAQSSEAAFIYFQF